MVTITIDIGAKLTLVHALFEDGKLCNVADEKRTKSICSVCYHTECRVKVWKEITDGLEVCYRV